MLDGKIEEESKLSSLLNKNKKYQKYLKEVVENVQGSDDFSEIQDILDRYATLKSTNTDLLSQIQVNTREHEARRFSYAQFMKKSANEMLNMNNEIARLQKELEQVTIASNKVESLDFGTCQNVNELATEISQALLVIDNMMGRLLYQAHESLSKNQQSPKNGIEGRLMHEKVEQSIKKLDTVTDLIIDFESIANENTSYL